jgi:hypothetical protein
MPVLQEGKDQLPKSYLTPFRVQYHGTALYDTETVLGTVPQT